MDPPATACEHQPLLLDCFVSALWAYNRTAVAMIETAFAFVHAQRMTRPQPVRTFPRCVPTIEQWLPFAPVSCFLYFTPAFCRKHVTFYMHLLRPHSATPEDIDGLCNEL